MGTFDAFVHIDTYAHHATQFYSCVEVAKTPACIAQHVADDSLPMKEPTMPSQLSTFLTIGDEA